MLPDDHKGFVLKRTAAADSGGCEESMSHGIPSWSTTGTFDEVSYWNHDTPASSVDTAPRAFEWLALVSSVQAPVTGEQVDAELAKASIPGESLQKTRDLAQQADTP